MKQGQDLAARFPGILIVHQKIRGHSVQKHRHHEHEVFLPLQGEIQIEGSGVRLKAGPGKMIYLPPKLEHSFGASESSQGERLIFMLEDKAWKAHGGGTFPPSVVSSSQLCKEILFHLLIYPKTKAAKSLIETLVQTISEMLEFSNIQACSDLIHLEGKISDQRIKNALAQIQLRFNLSLSMDELARVSGLSTRNLNRLFLTELGMTPKELITLYRIDRAKSLLRAGKNSVTDIALEVGYSSVSQFITTFRRTTGQLPSEFY